MIQGLRLRITPAEIREHCQARAAYHRGRAAEKEAKIPVVQEAFEVIDGDRRRRPVGIGAMAKGVGYHASNPVDDIETDIESHLNRALVFEFYAAHLFEDDYDLGAEDLVRLEMLRI